MSIKAQDKPKTAKFRTVSTSKYIMAGILTILVFSLGLSLGIILEDQRYSWAQEINEEQDINYISLQLQYLLLSDFEGDKNCDVLFTTLKDAVDDLGESLGKILDYEKDNTINQDDYNLILRRYTLDNIRYWLLANKAESSCDFNAVSILYFYSDDCPSCPNQGTILTYFKKQLGEQLLVFPINIDLQQDEPIVDIIMQLHNVTKYPTLIIEDEKYEGVVKTNKMEKIICSQLEDLYICQE